jgi:hypothetical protein
VFYCNVLGWCAVWCAEQMIQGKLLTVLHAADSTHNHVRWATQLCNMCASSRSALHHNPEQDSHSPLLRWMGKPTDMLQNLLVEFKCTPKTRLDITMWIYFTSNVALHFWISQVFFLFLMQSKAILEEAARFLSVYIQVWPHSHTIIPEFTCSLSSLVLILST